MPRANLVDLHLPVTTLQIPKAHYFQFKYKCSNAYNEKKEENKEMDLGEIDFNLALSRKQ